MPVQMIELEEVHMVETTDESLEAAVTVLVAFSGPQTYNPACE